MKARQLLLMLAASCVTTQFTPATSAATAVSSVGKAYDQTTTAIEAGVGEHFVILVPGNATSSFTWRAEPQPKASVLAVADPAYTPQPPPDCNHRCLGYGGTYSFGVNANAAGVARVHLVKVHVGRSPGTPVQEVSIAVTVK